MKGHQPRCATRFMLLRFCHRDSAQRRLGNEQPVRNVLVYTGILRYVEYLKWKFEFYEMIFGIMKIVFCCFGIF